LGHYSAIFWIKLKKTNHRAQRYQQKKHSFKRKDPLHATIALDQAKKGGLEGEKSPESGER